MLHDIIRALPARHRNVSRTFSCTEHPITELWHRIPSRSITEHHRHHGHHGTDITDITDITARISRTSRSQSRVHHAVLHHCQVEAGCQTKTFKRSASKRITAHHRESRSITEITEHHVHHGVRHGASRSGPRHGRSQHG